MWAIVGSSQARELAESALNLCQQFGGSVPYNHMLSRLSRIATSGKFPANAERDLHVILREKALNVQIDYVPARLWSPKHSQLINGQVAVIMPDKLAAAIWSLGPDIFRWFFMGDMTASDVKCFWDHTAETSEWFRAHPLFTYVHRERLIPFSFYGDEVNVYKNTEVGSLEVLCWSSDLVFNHQPMARYFLLGTYSAHTASEYTYSDVMRAVIQRANDMFDPAKKYPWSDKFQFIFSSCQGDLKWLNEKHGFHVYTRNYFCSWCWCCKKHADVSQTLGDMREEAGHRQTRITHADFLRETPPEQSGLFLPFTFYFSYLCCMMLYVTFSSKLL